MSAAPLPPGSTLGIVGVGQLGQMLAVAAARLGFRVRTFGPDEDPPAARVAQAHMAAPYEDEEALRRFAGCVDAATYEFENIPPRSVAVLQDHVPVRPGAEVLAVCQDRLEEKRFLSSLGIPVAPHAPVDHPGGAAEALRAVGGEGILKTRRFGYDGKGQVRLRAGDDPAAGFAEAGGAPAIIEGFVPFEAELSQIAARSVDGAIAFYDTPRNDHESGILRRSTLPSGLPEEVSAQARALTGKVLEALGYVGVMTLEFFWSRDGGLVANEIAPRVHNSGHWTREACVTSQFEQHVRAVMGWPLGAPDRQLDAEMVNLIGADAEDWLALASEPGARMTLYGKAEARPGRKMGHVVRTRPRQ
ncbi:5-(carboxyamino)imidazole ribonucleotide synthase [Parvularcula oceani]|uniref:5-(carboxyamino)imidazole ribonucleotide synthase n=1 Tax=Parvularcula oceani TaxID=1247963 RepID=UPI0004E1AFDE|nr:5-(carboxyamino)imidazole ribonucleotide synthase [Parvularcula oceani]